METQIAFFVKHYDVWALSHIPDYLNGTRKLRRDTVIFTFDDGYVDDYRNACPILKKYRVPATFFVASGPLCDRNPYWFDQLGLHLTHLDAQRDFNIVFHDPVFSNLLNLYRQPTDVESQKRAATKIFAYLNSISEERREALLDSLAKHSRLRHSMHSAALQMLTVSQVIEMVNAGHEIGAHSVTHPVLSRLNQGRVREEIEDALQAMSTLGIKVKSFAYPFGTEDDIGSVAPLILEENGIAIGVTTEEKTVSLNDNPRLLPRKVISTQTLGQIALRLERLAWRF